MSIKKIWLYPPMAIARIGPSETPCNSFHWGPNDLHPRGSGKTTIQPSETFHIDENGSISSTIPQEISFKDENGFRPVCPFFELHGEWQDGEETLQGPITFNTLSKANISIDEVKWNIEVANLKAFHYTLNNDDRISAKIEVLGNDTKQKILPGKSIGQGENSLVPAETSIPLGKIQLVKPSEQFPTLRLRFTPPEGKIYAPTNLAERSEDYKIPTDCLILNPQASWCKFQLKDDPRTNPSGLFAQDKDEISLGIVDDVSDGIIICTIGNLKANARIVVSPPDYAPDRRPFIALSDGLSDRVHREDVHNEAYFEDEQISAEIRDLLEKILETMGLINLDAQNDRVRSENRRIAEQNGLPPSYGENQAFLKIESLKEQPFPITENGRQKHRRLVALEVLEDKLRENPNLIEKWIRKPMTGDKFYDKKMPALMRGSDRYPLHLTTRQYDTLLGWVKKLRSEIEGGT